MEIPVSKPEKKKRKALKIFIGIVLLFILSVFGTGIYVLTHTEEIKRYILSQLNASLKTEINVETIDATFLKTFPFVALEFQNVWAKEVASEKHIAQDTLLKAKRIYLEFDLLDILRGKYQVKNIVVKEAGFYMKVFADGENNYEFWKSSPDSVKNEDLFKLSLRRIRLTHTEFIYHNEITRQHYHCTIEKARAGGNFSSDIQNLKLHGDILIHSVVSDQNKLFQNAPITLSIDFTHDVLQHRIAIQEGEISYRKMDFTADGHLVYGDQENSIKLDLQGKKLSMKDLITALPEKYRGQLSSMKASGELEIQAKVFGIFNARQLPHINLNFHLRNGKLYEKHSKQTLDALEIQGCYSNGKHASRQTSFLRLNKVGFRLNNGFLRGSVAAENFNAPKIVLRLSTQLQLQELLPFIPSKDIEKLKGNMLADISLSGKISDLQKRNRQSFQNLSFAGNVDVENFSLTLKSFPQSFHKTTLKFAFDKHHVQIVQAKGYVGKTSFDIQGSLSNIFPFLFLDNEYMKLTGNVAMGNIVIENRPAKENNNTVDAGIPLPQSITMDLSTRIESLSYKKMRGEKISAKLTVGKDGYSIKNLRMNAIGGTIVGNVEVHPKKDNGYLLAGNITTDKVRIENAFTAFDNFGQATLTDKNLSGQVSSQLNFSVILSPSGEPDLNSLKVAVHSVIEQGAIKNFDLLRKLSHFVSEETLANVHFQTLTNDLTIADRKITFEEMAISSNVANFTIAGSHTFDKAIDYALKISFSELISRKKRENMKREQEEFSSYFEDEDNRLKAYVKIKGTTENPIFQYDLQTNLRDIKQNIKEDKKTVLESIDRDLQLNIKENQKQKEVWRKQEQGEYIIEWDETPAKDSITKEKTPETKFTIEWDNE